MGKKVENIDYALIGINTEQFATPAEPSGDSVTIESQLKVKTSYDKRAIGMSLEVKMYSEGLLFLIGEVSNHFVIKKECWEILSKDNTSDVKLKSSFVREIYLLTEGSLRGIIHTKTESTAYNKYFLPLNIPDREVFEQGIIIKKI